MLTEELRFDYVIRFRGNITVTAATGEVRTAAAWVGPGGRARVLRGALVTAERYPVGTVVCVQDHATKQAWCLATSTTDATAKALMGLYGKTLEHRVHLPRRQGPALRHGDGLGPCQHARPARPPMAAERVRPRLADAARRRGRSAGL